MQKMLKALMLIRQQVSQYHIQPTLWHIHHRLLHWKFLSVLYKVRIWTRWGLYRLHTFTICLSALIHFLLISLLYLENWLLLTYCGLVIICWCSWRTQQGVIRCRWRTQPSGNTKSVASVRVVDCAILLSRYCIQTETSSRNLKRCVKDVATQQHV